MATWTDHSPFAERWHLLLMEFTHGRTDLDLTVLGSWRQSHIQLHLSRKHQTSFRWRLHLVLTYWCFDNRWIIHRCGAFRNVRIDTSWQKMLILCVCFVTVTCKLWFSQAASPLARLLWCFIMTNVYWYWHTWERNVLKLFQFAS